jgi:hypothetical protein
MMILSIDIDQLASALAAAQGEIENASKNSQNPHFRSKYADLAEIINTVRPVFSKHGLAVVQSPSYAEGLVSVTTLLTHKSGQWIRDTATAPASKLDAQGVGSAITYLRRYSLAAFAGIAQEDDDGNAASQQKAKVNTPSKEAIAQATAELRSCKTLDDLKAAFSSFPADVRTLVGSIKDEMKEQLS